MRRARYIFRSLDQASTAMQRADGYIREGKDDKALTTLLSVCRMQNALVRELAEEVRDHVSHPDPRRFGF